MCLSKVYLRERGKDKIVFEEATNITDNFQKYLIIINDII